MISIGADAGSSRKAELQRAIGDLRLMVAWWFIVACFITVCDVVLARIASVSLATSAAEHVWYAMLSTGLIGALSADRNKLLWCLISAVGGLLALAITVTAVMLMGGLFAS